MKNILILAEGPIARHFLEWINKARIAENQYHVACYKGGVLPEKMSRAIAMCHTDPTSYSKLLNLMSETRFAMVFIIMEDKDDAYYSLQNVRKIDDKVLIVLLDKWDGSYENIQNITIINERQLMAAHLYDYLPNVPVVAQNVGLGKGEIMEVLVPFGSSYAYRHIGSIAQRKWKIAAIYRKEKQIIPTNATMIQPNDTLLILGKPMVLDGIYRAINKRKGLFPEPFGKNLYLILDLEIDKEKAMVYLNESIYLTDRLEDKQLEVRIFNPSDFSLIDALKEQQKENVSIHISYDEKDIDKLIEYDIQNFDIGLVLNSIETFDRLNIKTHLYNLKKLIYLFGEKSLYNITECVALMTDEAEMESISSTTFNLSESLDLKLKLCNYDPEGDFESKKMIIDHYEALSQIFNREITVDQEIANPVRKIRSMENILLIIPFDNKVKRKSIFNLISTHIKDYLLTFDRHPKILVPIEASVG